MKIVPCLAVTALLLAGCQSGNMSQRDRLLVGGGLGAATGATIGAIAGSSTGAALAGAAVGAVGGGIVGYMTMPKDCIAKDNLGRPFRVACP